MEYTRFPQAAVEPPRASALRGLTWAFPPAGVSYIPFARFKLNSFSTRKSEYPVYINDDLIPIFVYI